MRKPPNLTRKVSTFPVKFSTSSQSLNVQVNLDDNSNVVLTDFKSVQYIANPQADWAQNDQNAPDYIKNKEIAEELRPIFVDGREFLSKDRDSGVIEIVAGENVTLTTEGNKLFISATATQVDPCDCEEYVEGEGIDIRNNEDGQKVVSLEPGSIDDNFIESVSVNKIIQGENDTIILNGGSIDG